MANIVRKNATVDEAGLLNKDTATVLAAGSFVTIDGSGEAVAVGTGTTKNVAFTVEGAGAGELEVGYVSDSRLLEVDVAATLTDAHRGIVCGFDASGVADQSDVTDGVVKIIADKRQDSYIGTTKALVRIIETL